MSTLKARTATGGEGAAVELPDEVFGIEPNVAVMHQVVTAQLAAARAGTHSTKTRAEVAGGGAKPWRQKGTGRARQGSTRAPHWRGGGIAHGPKPRSYVQRTPKKMKALALRSALSDRAADGKVLVVDDFGISAPKTKDGIARLEALGLRTKGERDARVLVVLHRGDTDVWKSLRNVPRVQIILPEELNPYDVLVNDWLVFSTTSLDTTVARLTKAARSAAPVEAVGAPAAEADESPAAADTDETAEDAQ